MYVVCENLDSLHISQQLAECHLAVLSYYNNLDSSTIVKKSTAK